MAVIQIEHVGNGIYPQSVYMKLAQPKQGTGNQEGLYFCPAIIKVHRIPFFVFCQYFIARFVAGLAVKMPQSMGIPAKMAWHPVQNDTDALPMAYINQIHQIFRRAVAAGC